MQVVDIDCNHEKSEIIPIKSFILNVCKTYM